MSPEPNPYSPPKYDSLTAAGDPALEAIRREHINAEANIKTIAVLVCLGAVASLLAAVEVAQSDPSSALLSFIQGAALGLSGYWLWRLDSRGRMVYTVVVALLAGAALFLGGDLSAYEQGRELGRFFWPALLLAILWVQKASTVMTPHYRDVVIPATPNVKRKTSALVLVLAVLLLVLLVGLVIIVGN